MACLLSAVRLCRQPAFALHLFEQHAASLVNHSIISQSAVPPESCGCRFARAYLKHEAFEIHANASLTMMMLHLDKQCSAPPANTVTESLHLRHLAPNSCAVFLPATAHWFDHNLGFLEAESEVPAVESMQLVFCQCRAALSGTKI